MLLPCASPLYIGVEGAGFLPSKSIGALAKVGGKKSHYFLPHRLLSPLFRDLDLIPLGYDLIPSKGGSWCALTRGVGPFPHYPRSCGSPHATVLDVVEQFPDLRTPPESSGTFWKLPGTIPKKPELFPEPEQQLSIINIYLQTIPEVLVTSGISSGIPNNIR